MNIFFIDSTRVDIREVKMILVYNYRELMLLPEQNRKKSRKIINLKLETVCHNNEDK